MKKRVHAFYSGKVQGVGFRFTAERIARSYRVDGWIRNVPDGRVELMAEGDEEELSRLLKEIETGILEYYIRGVDAKWGDSRDEFKGFDIRF